MAYITIHCADGRNLGRYPLDGCLVLGRSPDCDIRIHDILASREHCGLEREDDAWVVVDLNSRNGTTVNGQRITRHKLADNDALVIGRTRITFHDEVLIESESTTREFSPSDRPANPMEALSGTVVDYSLNPKFEPPVERPIIRPMPRPMPIANRSPLPQSPALSLPASLSVCDSSPTWATKRTSPPPSPRLMAQEQDLGAPCEAAIPTTPWTRRARLAIAEVLVASALTGAAVVGTVAALTH
ncbi:MAG TPA: FHA domain-containing protein [Tepidisphaeraceae bacterium]|jgi:predicted component of type VI protein secretion system|nr:FHA domain-containing protein [Tepidisphaeraceae bacterium]